MFQRFAGRISGAGVFVAAKFSDTVLKVGAGLVDRHAHRSGARFGDAAVMNGGGFEFHASALTSCSSR
ncbi:hypothetical protein SDC9_209067 [bioreactor metagenome]|uniref:Uncharacterized protein n=1 Tax=bioreactor metagenome TaxID=1076179 RepID=A0A645JCE3_9ZZZZ